MQIYTNIPLKNYVTMKVGGNARFMTDATTPNDAATICQNAKKQNIPILFIGGGSNVVARDEGYKGLVMRMRIPGFEIVTDDDNSTTIKVGAGEEWDSVVRRSVEMNLSGIEAMSAIPGTAGATPVQNVGAYGQEIADTLQSLEAYDTKTEAFATLSSEQCGFSYRNSIFKTDEYGRYAITSITLKLRKSLPQPPFYESLQKYLDEHNIKIYTPETIRDAVIELRKIKLPDPKSMPSSGSFFKNALVEKWQLDDLMKIDPNIPMHDMGNGTYKIPSGWLIERTGLKGQLLHGIRVYDKNSLVLINESATGYADLSQARDEIIGKVRDMFRIQIEQEPMEI